MDTPTRIAHARRARGLSQEALARQLGVSTRTVVRMERKDKGPTLPMLRRVAALLGVSEAWLVAGEGQGPAEPPDVAAPAAA
jgi:transcriptional regulator with XRE-family HTH domain